MIEIGAGTGRVLLPIAEKHPDLEFHAVDVIGDEVAVLADKARARRIDNIVPHVADINAFESDEKFAFAFAPFRVLQHCRSVEEMDRFVKSTRDLLTENGRFAFDLFNPWVHMLVREGVVFDGNYHDEEGNRINRRWKSTSAIISSRRRTLRNIIRYSTRTAKPTSSNGFIPPVIFQRHGVAGAGENELTVENLYGHFDRTPFGQGEYPGELIFDCVKKRKGR